MNAKRERIDKLIVAHGIAESRSIAQRLVMAGEISVDGQLVHKPSDQFPEDCQITLAQGPKYVSRGGLKLEKALDSFTTVQVEGKVCVDIGASTGGFTDCLLQNGAAKVYAIDVGYGQLHQSLRVDTRVVVMERTNIKDITGFGEEIGLVVIDVSFISLKRVFPVVIEWNQAAPLEIIALIKPQFEVGKKIAAAGKGVIRNEKDRQTAIDSVHAYAQSLGMQIHGITESPIQGPKGNIEYLLHLSYNPEVKGKG
jgi:23S rRNA (cytidine1920-2'-O)/16S rRNA (cytidine1409-2'-O)-methyltransferase